MTIDPSGFVLLLLVLLAWRILMWWWYQYGQDRPAVAAQVERLLKPHIPHDCPTCRQPAAGWVEVAVPHAPVPPRRERKSRRGAPKRIDTAGFACSNPTCAYYRISDAQIHALVGDGVEGKTERIQTFRCQACGTTFSARYDTPLYGLKTSSQRVAEVLTALAAGLRVSAAVRVFGHRHATITTWLTRAGHTAQPCMSTSFRISASRIFNSTNCGVGSATRHTRCGSGWWSIRSPRLSQYCITQRVPGARTQTAAHVVVHELRGRLATGCLPVFTSDGLNQYFYALTAHFGQWVAGVGRRARRWQVAAGLIYGQVKKRYRRRQLVGSRMCCGVGRARRSSRSCADWA